MNIRHSVAARRRRNREGVQELDFLSHFASGTIVAINKESARVANLMKPRLGPLWVLSLVLPGALAGCTALPTDAVDKLDPDTATTVTVLPNPIELITESTRGRVGDPFAYVAPFETDRQGEHSLYVWISAPQNSGPIELPKLICDDRPVTLKAVAGDLAELKLSQPPYRTPAPWSSQWYFVVSPEGLECLSMAQAIALDTQPVTGDPERFSASGKTLLPLHQFARH